MSKDDNRCQQTPPDVIKLVASVVVCWHLLLAGDVWWVSGGYLVGVCGFLSDKGLFGNMRSRNAVQASEDNGNINWVHHLQPWFWQG